MIFLGLDYGKKRIGVSVSDELARFAEPVGYVSAYPEEELWVNMTKLIRETRAETVVVGVPIRTTGELKTEAESALAFAEKLKKRFSVSVMTWDERFSTAEAERKLREIGYNERKMKPKKDAAAASIMLQSFLDAQRMRDHV